MLKSYLEAIGAIMEDPRFDQGTLKITCNMDGEYVLKLYTDDNLVVTEMGTTIEGVLKMAGEKVLKLIED